MKKIALLLALISFKLILNAQSIHGHIENLNGEPLAGASIQIENGFKTAIADANGDFKFSGLKPGKYNLLISFIGYKNEQKFIELQNVDFELNIVMEEATNLTDEVLVNALRAGRNTPVVSSELDKAEIKKNNLGMDVPYLLYTMPSMTATSDAGSGIGYSKLSVRGTDLSRINVTVNGIPLNDAESHGVWWVDLPDLASSVENIQIQRGVGTSTNGTSAFGANINFQTTQLNKEAYGELSGSLGTFNTYKTSMKAGTGLINKHFAFDMRLSKIHSDGFIDRAKTDMESFFASGSYSDKKTLLKFNVISGTEDTYQAWNGVPKARLENNTEEMMRYQNHYLYTEEETQHMLNSDSRTYNFYTYDNEIDHYKQTHYQAFISREIIKELNLNLAFNYTKGKGYYEQSKKDKKLADYGLSPAIIGTDTMFNTDLIQRKWLDNDLFALTYSIDYQNDELKTTLGGSWQNYFGKHYGEIIWARYASNSEIRQQWYNSTGDKQDFNIFGKVEYLLFNQLNLYADLQYRMINYTIEGSDDDLPDISQKHDFSFFNPKFGVNYLLDNNQNFYFTFGTANREPARADYIDITEGKSPVHETMYDYELGYTLAQNNAKININLYYMDYTNQLVKTGKINNVGTAIMTNIPESYRMGIEISGGIKISELIDWQANATFSRNKILDYTEYTDNWETGIQDEIYIGKSNISFSPEIITGSQLIFKPLKDFEIAIISKFVGEQYIDNSSAKDRMLDAYFVNNIRLNYHFETKLIKRIDFQLLVNNIFNEKYETDAWAYRYYYEGGYHNMDGYFPQAGTNLLAGLILSF